MEQIYFDFVNIQRIKFFERAVKLGAKISRGDPKNAKPLSEICGRIKLPKGVSAEDILRDIRYGMCNF